MYQKEDNSSSQICTMKKSGFLADPSLLLADVLVGTEKKSKLTLSQSSKGPEERIIPRINPADYSLPLDFIYKCVGNYNCFKRTNPSKDMNDCLHWMEQIKQHKNIPMRMTKPRAGGGVTKKKTQCKTMTGETIDSNLPSHTNSEEETDGDKTMAVAAAAAAAAVDYLPLVKESKLKKDMKCNRYTFQGKTRSPLYWTLKIVRGIEISNKIKPICICKHRGGMRVSEFICINPWHYKTNNKNG
jgi:hypothetical protein